MTTSLLSRVTNQVEFEREIVLHHQFARLTMQQIEEIFFGGRWREIVRTYVSTYRLKPGMRILEEDERDFRKEPQNLFETAHGPLLRRTLRDYWSDARVRGAPDVFFESFFSDLARHRIVTIGDIIFTSRKWWNTNYPPGYHAALHEALGELREYLHADKGPEWFARPTAAERAVLDSLPRP